MVVLFKNYYWRFIQFFFRVNLVIVFPHKTFLFFQIFLDFILIEIFYLFFIMIYNCIFYFLYAWIIFHLKVKKQYQVCPTGFPNRLHNSWSCSLGNNLIVKIVKVNFSSEAFLVLQFFFAKFYLIYKSWAPYSPAIYSYYFI